MQESYRQALGGIYPVPVLFFAKALYAMRESVILGMGQRRKPQEKEGTKQMKFDMHCHTKEGSMDGKVPIDDFIAELIRKGFDGMWSVIIIHIMVTARGNETSRIKNIKIL